MIPIFEQGKSKGIGHSYDSFIMRFREICREHVAHKRAKAFAFIFYDFQDKAIKNILKSQGGFAQLDRLSGRDLSIFYLHSENRQLLKSFNSMFKDVFDINETVQLPFVLFLKFDNEINEITDFKLVILEQTNYLFSFKELYDTIQSYVDQLKDSAPKINTITNRVINLLDKGKKILISEFVKLVIQDVYQRGKDSFQH